ncbi:MAG: hydroxymethylpyrimidine/phosphomethylpyrimidine kinase [bacterium]|nr:hydroxymethylpyrimidine/phosphomethylpyrimidine kinase [bacterium]
MNKPTVLTIAGFDPSSGAGITADFRAFHDLRCFGAAVITAITFQNSRGVTGFTALPVDTIRRQFAVISEDYVISAVKIGMLGDEGAADILSEITALLTELDIPVVIDPVYESSDGKPLFTGDWDSYFAKIAPRAALLTPNSPELARLTESQPATNVSQLSEQAGRLFADTGIPVLAKGGHIKGDVVTDILIDDHGARQFEGRAYYYEVHGTGCLLSAAITAFLGRCLPLYEAVEEAEHYVNTALKNPQRPGKGSAIAGTPGDMDAKHGD